jgi:hypothetical protein
MINRGGGAEMADLAPRPASMSPRVDQIAMSPPANVKTRDWLTSTSPSD